MPVDELFHLIAPPLRLVIWLEKSIEQQRAAGKVVPPEITEWLERWQRIRSHLPAVTDGATAQQWASVEQRVVAN